MTMKDLFTFHMMSRKWRMVLLCLIVIFLAVPGASTACPTCSGRPAAVWGWQPHRSTLGSTFDDAATDSLVDAPDYDQIWRGVCPDCSQVSVSTSEPIPNVTLKAIGFRESSWRQFDCDYPDHVDGSWDNTLISQDCGYGIMQMTSCMYDGCGWFTPNSVASSIEYNVGTGTNFLIRKWNQRSCYIGDRNHTDPEDWYYTVISYGTNGWSNRNNPNNKDRHHPDRPPYLEGEYDDYRYPYQEYIWGHMAHPSSLDSQELWTAERVPWVPRGIFGPNHPTYWEPPAWTPRPTFYYLPDIKANWYDWNSDIVIQNPRSDLTLAVDIALYKWLGTFNRWWLDPPSHDPPPYIRLEPGASRTIAVADRFPGSDYIIGSAVNAASEDVAVVVENQHGNIRYAYSGIAASDPLNPDWGQVGTELYAPVIMNDYYGWYSWVFLLHAGSARARVDVEYYGPNGTTPVYTDWFWLSPNDRVISTYYGAEDTLYSARIVSDQPLAAVGFQFNWDSTVFLAYNCLSASDSPVYVYAPLIMNNYYGWDTSVNIQNTGDSTAWVYVRYYNTSGIQVGPLHVDQIPPYASRSRYSPSEEGLPDNFIGTARIYSYQQPLAVVVNQSSPHGGSPVRGQSYDGTSKGSTYVVLPDVLNYYGDENWVSSVNVQNLSTVSSTDVTLTYQGWYVTRTINRKGFFSFYVPYYWGTTSSRGPATVSSDSQPVAVVVNHGSVDQTWVDLARSYNGCNR
jgi:hypothetical protein